MQELFRITGSAAPTLEGSIRTAGAKNAVLKAMAASVLYRTPLALTNVPAIADVASMAQILEALGGNTSRSGDALNMTTSGMSGSHIPAAMMSTLRASIVLAGPLLARFGEVLFSHPGGDIIGERPIDLFLETFEKMGAKVVKEDGSYGVRVPGGRLKGAELFFRIQSVTGTETAMLAAVLADGTTTIKNAALEPEIVWLADLLNASGAQISGAGTPTITIVGTEELLRAPAEPFAVVPDRIEAGSFLLLGVLAAKDLLIEQCVPGHLEAVLHTLRTMGADIEAGPDFLRVRATPALRPAYIKTHEYPGYPTDLMAPMVTLLTQVTGESRVFETIWDNRLAFVEVLRVMGADIVTMDPHRVLIHGARRLVGKKMESPDIRAGLAYLVAAAVADGTSEISNIHHIDRGYENIAERLRAIGMQIERVGI
ncbi:MAG: UDP-N-acetylglucosamine 1-carboxyvinyltransferase, UDP-N-acetylglucosamine 1-carboxyvinyltransferase [Candidatus Adlerbacteria bacterium]|nr:UDP-N-acetylglucosamine 1-carboxyvinyltransferase, UDP-N-acetylglucosamine 1-carboxyvinyltransferase [Candidatus Adlerbacteria bacterium]